jgi:hypothetical protein
MGEVDQIRDHGPEFGPQRQGEFALITRMKMLTFGAAIVIADGVQTILETHQSLNCFHPDQNR